jgi:hypothetical protein
MKQETKVLKQIAQLPGLSFEELKERWRALYGTEPPAYNKPFLIKRLAYRIQELAYGGLSENAKARLDEIARENGMDELASLDRTTPRKKGMPVIGTRLVREWNGDRYEVTVVHNGFEFRGKTFRSLTSITKAITGTHWNGPAFFGLRRGNNGDGRK